MKPWAKATDFELDYDDGIDDGGRNCEEAIENE